MLRKIDSDIWVAEQPLRYFGLSIGARMTIIRLVNGELVVISPIQINETLGVQLEEIGTVRHIIAPNLYHYFFASDFKTRYPNAIFWSVPGLKAKRPDLAIDQVITSKVSPWDGIEYVFFDGFRTPSLQGLDVLNECVFFHGASRTLVLTDTAIHFDESFPIITQFAARVLGGYKTLRPSLLERIATTEKNKVRGAAEKVLHWDFERVIMAHGTIVEQNGKEKFRNAYNQF